MKTTLKIASVLTWFNLIWWGLNLITSLPGAFAMGVPMLAFIVVLASIPLNCYAALQLHKSIRHPSVRLSSQVPIGIRFVGLAAEFCGFILIILGFFFLMYTAQLLTIAKDPAVRSEGIKEFLNPRGIRLLGGFLLFLGLCISANVILNFRLLRWYYLVRQSDADTSESNDGH
ncbi:MAG TPA: hypothetical protein VGN00_23935 [Puia sp.]|jgi:hypothetical protein